VKATKVFFPAEAEISRPFCLPGVDEIHRVLIHRVNSAFAQEGGSYEEKGDVVTTKIDPDLIKKTIDFHGHWCPGLAIGIRAGELALEEIGKASDEEIVAVVETDMCAVDAIQYLTGCTFGKGNLIYKDHGKTAFTFYRRRDNKAIRLVRRREIPGGAGPVFRELNRKVQEEGLTAAEEKTWREIREKMAKQIMESDLSRVFEIKKPNDPVPKKARMVATLVCESCGEPVMETRTRRFRDKVLCIPCFEILEKRY
jgi:formylmethanofuran dehydrogenase subunit E